MDASSGEQLQLTAEVASNLQNWDLECATKHMDAIKDSVLTHDQVHSFVLMKDEHPINELSLAGLQHAPGAFTDLTQRCRLVFTNQKRLVFTQVNHSAEVGTPEIRFLSSLLTCCHDLWSRRKWRSYYATIHASEVLEVFVQQALTTHYHTANWNFNDCFDVLSCPRGGTMYSEKDIDGVTQTLGDHDPGEYTSRWDKTRYMRHALVIRYVDYASATVSETVAFANPRSPAANLFEMARTIEANITLRKADFFKEKRGPIPLMRRAFFNDSPTLLFQRIKQLLKVTGGILLFVATISFLASQAVLGVVLVMFALGSLCVGMDVDIRHVVQVVVQCCSYMGG
ncbi:unnamed protein product [Scytosiphon promiscuus]